MSLVTVLIAIIAFELGYIAGLLSESLVRRAVQRLFEND